MHFVTIHDLSRELNIPERVIRYRLLKLIAEGKFKEHDDFRRDDFQDDFHFIWKVHPLRFMAETGVGQSSSSIGNTSADRIHPFVNHPVSNAPPIVNEQTVPAINAGSSIGTKTPDESMARELIDVLKDQIRVKDSQLQDARDQLKETHELNVKLTGTMLQQAAEIKNLLQLTGGKTEVAANDGARVSKVVNDGTESGNNTDTNSSALGYQTVTDEIHKAA